MDQLPLLLWLQGLRKPLLTQFFTLMTFFGSEEFILIFLALVYWCVNRTVGLRLGLVFIGSQYVNEGLKYIAHEPRPGPPVEPLATDTATGWAWPSGHAQNTAATWGTLAGLIRDRRLTTFALILIFLVGLSRLYLGVHWPFDVLSGWIIGGLLAGIGLWAFERWDLAIAPVPGWPWLAAGVIVPLVLFALYPTDNNAKAMGAGIGLIAGWWLERRTVGFEAAAPLTQQAIKAVLGLVVAFGLRILLKPVFDLLPVAFVGDLLRYAIIGLWVAWLAPLLFVRLFGRTAAVAPAPADGSPAR
jgi:membrane-associated phospholipid phosphatase